MSTVSAVVGQKYALEPEAMTSFPPPDQHRAVDLLPMATNRSVAVNLVSFAMGRAFRRFAEKPFHSTDGTFPLVGAYATVGLPTSSEVFADDPGHPRDIVATIGTILAECGTALEDVEATLGVDLRAFMSKHFFDVHRAQYSHSRRKAPVYWQLATPSASYSIWIYLHELNNDTLFRLRGDFIIPKLELEQKNLEALLSEVGTDNVRALREQIELAERFVDELTMMRDQVTVLASLWNPDLDDGVMINFAMLWRLVAHTPSWQKDLRAKWEELTAGRCDWAHLAMHLWPERVIPKCSSDRSLAIAHGLEDVFWFEDETGRWKPRKSPLRPVDELVAERTSSAVKDALKSVLETPEPVAPTKRRRKSRAG